MSLRNLLTTARRTLLPPADDVDPFTDAIRRSLPREPAMPVLTFERDDAEPEEPER